MTSVGRLQLVPLALVGALSAGAALAEDAIATTELNVRSGPGTSFAVVDVLAANERVTMSECQASGWCYITHDGPDGWVSASYLAPVPGTVETGGADCRVVIEIGPGGPSFRLECGGISVGGAAPEPEPEPAEDDVGACFWRNADYGGATFCGGLGTVAQLEGQFNDSISSLRVYGGAKVKLCEDADLDGYCRIVTADTAALGPLINNRASSLVIYTGAAPPVDLIPMPPLGPFEAMPFPLPLDTPPVTLSTGTVDLPQTWQMDLDDGSLGSGGGADLWFRAQTATQRFLQPVGGAQFAFGDGSNRGRDGCRDAAFSTASIPVTAGLVGRYICIRTDAGRTSQIRINALDGTILRLGYTTWAN